MEKALIVSSSGSIEEIESIISKRAFKVKSLKSLPENYEDYQVVFADKKVFDENPSKADKDLQKLKLAGIPCVLIVDEIEFPEPDKEASFYGCDAFITTPIRKNMVILALRAAINLKTLSVSNERLKDALFTAESKSHGKDSSSGLYIFSESYDLIVREIALAKRYKYNVSIALGSFVNLDPETAADKNKELFDQIQYLLKRTIRVVDLVVGMENNLYMFIMPFTDSFGAVKVGERISDKVSQQNFEGNPIGFSLGISVFTGGNFSLEQLITECKTALEESHKTGRSPILFQP